MTIGLIDVDSVIPNLALMKISNYYKSLGEKVEFVRKGGKYTNIYASAIFTRSQNVCKELLDYYGDIIDIGGSGWNIKKVLEPCIESIKPDYDLYSVKMIANRIKGIGTRELKLRKAKQLIDSGLGYKFRGCKRHCAFCLVPVKEGSLKKVAEIKDLLNPKSNILILNDNNLTAEPDCIDTLNEIRDRNLIVDINQGIDIRLVNDDIARALSEVKHLRSLHYAWDLTGFEPFVINGIKILSKYIKPYRHMCFCLVGYNTTFEEDMYRFIRLRELGVDPYIMIYNQIVNIRLKHFARWVNGRIYKKCSFEEYAPWIKHQLTYYNQLSA